MCYSEHASIVSFSVNVITCWILYAYNPALAVFFLFTGQMQLYDLIFWKNQKQNAINYWVTKLAMFANHLQPIVLAFAIWIFNKRPLSGRAWMTVLIYTIATCIYFFVGWKKVQYTLVDKVSFPGLHWIWNDLPGNFVMYAIFLFTFTVLFYEGFDKPVNIILCIVCVITFVLSSVLFKSKSSIGRFWCYFAAFIPILIALLEIFLQSKRTTQMS